MSTKEICDLISLAIEGVDAPDREKREKALENVNAPEEVKEHLLTVWAVVEQRIHS